MKTTILALIYVLLGWATALHQYQYGTWDKMDSKGLKYLESTVAGIAWPVFGLFVWSDVYLWEKEQKPQVAESSADSVYFDLRICQDDTVTATPKRWKLVVKHTGEQK